MSAAESPVDSKQSITGRAGIVALGTLLSRILGLGRDLVLAASFSRAATDAFMVAFQLPNLLRQLLAEGAVQTAVLPVLSQVIEKKGEAAGRRYFQSVRGVSLTILAVVSLLGVIFAPTLVELFAGGFRARTEQFELTVALTRVVFPYIFFMGTTALGIAALNTHRRFVATSFAPALLNVSFIACALLLPALLAPQGIPTIYAMGFGALLGGVLQMMAQWPSLRAIGYLQSPRLDFTSPELRETFRRMVPTLFGIGVYYLDVLIGRRILSELGEGAVTYFGFALRLCDFPQGIFVMALQTATLPSLAALVARGQLREVTETFAFAVRLSLFVGLGATALVVALAEPLVSLTLERGSFDALASAETARALRAQGIGIFSVAAIRQLTAVFFALGDTKTPVWVAGVDLIAFVVAALALRGPLGHVGVSWAVSIASLVQLGLLAVSLSRRLGGLPWGVLANSTVRALGAGLGAAFGARLLHSSLFAPGPLGTLVAVAVFFGLYWALAQVFRCPELLELETALRARLRRRQA